jgi:hypothetical protein
MQTTTTLGALTPGTLVREGAELCEELVRRSGRVLTIPFAGRRLVVSFERLPKVRRVGAEAFAPELDDTELARMAARFGAPREQAWERSLKLQYGGH